MKAVLRIDGSPLAFGQLRRFVFSRPDFSTVALDPVCLQRANESRRHLSRLVEMRFPIYGVTTGFGDSCFRFVDPKAGESLQGNLVSYLLCGSGPLLPVEASRATLLIRLKSLSRGYSGVSPELLERMILYLSNDWIPAVPREGSLGASGDLIPLAYLAECLQGEGKLHAGGKTVATADVLKEHGVEAYRLKHKEGLALVNGTSAMAGLYLVNLVAAKYFLEVSTLATAWLCLAAQGRAEPFDKLVNEKASRHGGQSQVAKRIHVALEGESYSSMRLVRCTTGTRFIPSKTGIRSGARHRSSAPSWRQSNSWNGGSKMKSTALPIIR